MTREGLKSMNDMNDIPDKIKSPTLSYPQLLKLISSKTNLSTNTIEKVYIALIDYLIENLKVNGRTKFQWLGTFVCKTTKGGEKWMPQRGQSEQVLKYCFPKRKVYFYPASTFNENLNEDYGVNQFRAESKSYKRGDLIESGSALKAERNVMVKNLIREEVKKKDKDELEEMINEELVADVDWSCEQ